MRALRLGSYSMVATLPRIACLSSWKSIFRYSLRWPPPHGHGVDVPDVDTLRFVLLLERLLDLGLRRAGEDFERVAALRVKLVGALGDDRADHDLGRGFGRHRATSLWRELKFSSRSSR